MPSISFYKWNVYSIEKILFVLKDYSKENLCLSSIDNLISVNNRIVLYRSYTVLCGRNTLTQSLSDITRQSGWWLRQLRRLAEVDDKTMITIPA